MKKSALDVLVDGEPGRLFPLGSGAIRSPRGLAVVRPIYLPRSDRLVARILLYLKGEERRVMDLEAFRAWCRENSSPLLEEVEVFLGAVEDAADHTAAPGAVDEHEGVSGPG